MYKYRVYYEHMEPDYIQTVEAKNIKEAREKAEEKCDYGYEVIEVTRIKKSLNS